MRPLAQAVHDAERGTERGHGSRPIARHTPDMRDDGSAFAHLSRPGALFWADDDFWGTLHRKAILLHQANRSLLELSVPTYCHTLALAWRCADGFNGQGRYE